MCSKITIDLHSVKHEDAERKIVEVVEQYFGYNKMVTVICGNSEQMKQIVHQVIKDYHLKECALQLFDTQVVFYT